VNFLARIFINQTDLNLIHLYKLTILIATSIGNRLLETKKLTRLA